MKSTKIIVAILAVFITASCTSYKLAPGSYKVGKFTSTLPKKEYVLTSPTEFHEGSVYSHTNDFVLQTENLPKPKITREYGETFTFTPYKDGNFEKVGELEEAWRYEFYDEKQEFDSTKFSIKASHSKNGYIEASLKHTFDDEKNIEKILDPETGKQFLRVEDEDKPKKKKGDYGVYIANDIQKGLNLYSNSKEVRLENDEGEIIWKQETSNGLIWQFFEDLYIKDGSLYFTSYNKSIYCLDLGTGEINWILENTKKDECGSLKYHDGNLWIYYIDNTTDEGEKLSSWEITDTLECYKMNLDNLEILKVDDINYYDIWFLDGNFYIKRNGNLLEYDVDTGIETNEYIPPIELKNSYNYIDDSYISNPFFNAYATDDGIAIISFFNKETKETQTIYEFDLNIKGENYSSNFKRSLKLGLLRIMEKYCGFDEKEFFGFDPETATRTWTISKEKTGDDAYITYIGEDGVFIVDGATLYCYR